MSEADIEKLERGGGRGSRPSQDDDDCCGSFASVLIYFISCLLILCTFPFSLCVCIKMVQVSSLIIHKIMALILDLGNNVIFWKSKFLANNCCSKSVTCSSGGTSSNSNPFKTLILGIFFFCSLAWQLRHKMMLGSCLFIFLPLRA